MNDLPKHEELCCKINDGSVLAVESVVYYVCDVEIRMCVCVFLAGTSFI